MKKACLARRAMLIKGRRTGKTEDEALSRADTSQGDNLGSERCRKRANKVGLTVRSQK